MIDKKQLCNFLVKAKKVTYAAGDDAQSIKEEDKSTTLVYEEGDWKYHDNYFGGEPYGGREVVFYKDAPVFIMVYYGNVDESVTDIKSIYGFLQKALTDIPEEFPFRGPKRYKDESYFYINNYEGSLESFKGEEVIQLDGYEVYKAFYAGGLVDQR